MCPRLASVMEVKISGETVAVLSLKNRTFSLRARRSSTSLAVAWNEGRRTGNQVVLTFIAAHDVGGTLYTDGRIDGVVTLDDLF